MELFDEEFFENSAQKVVVGVRCTPDLKNELIIESQNIGISLSEYCENILLNKRLLKNNNKDFQLEIENLKKANNSLTEENTNLKNEIKVSITDNSLLGNKRLIQLFEILKGKSDQIKLDNGETFDIVYQQPKDLLEAMIYSFKCKK